MNLILLGAPGVGKGTQAHAIVAEKGLPQISTGDILRSEVKKGTDLGKQAEGFMTAGNLVPDDLIIAMIKNRLAEDDCKNGFILDGFPRTVPQADALSAAGIVIDKVIEITVSDEEIIKRITGRMTCPVCGKIYNKYFSQPKEEMKCDNDGATLSVRADDNEETVKNRLATYKKQTEPLVNYYSQKSKDGATHYYSINGSGTVEEIKERIFEVLKN